MHRRNGRVNGAVVRLLTTSALVLTACGATAAGAQAAGPKVLPPPPQCKLDRSVVGDSYQVVGIDEEVCIGPGGNSITPYPVVLSRLVGGTWVVLASGSGEVFYYCAGTTSYEYSANGVTGTFACG